MKKFNGFNNGRDTTNGVGGHPRYALQDFHLDQAQKHLFEDDEEMVTVWKKDCKKLLDNYEEQIHRQEEIVRKLESKIDFCTQHNLDEEKRITLVRWDALNMAIYRWRNMHNELREMLNEWQS